MTAIGMDRREVLAATAVIGAASLIPGGAAAQPAPAMAAAYVPQPVPLSFDPTRVTGLSEGLLTSHHANNYVGAVKRLGSIGAELAALDLSTAPGYRVNGLKREELMAWNSMLLHEIYFSQFGTPGRPAQPLSAAIEHSFGSEARWRSEFAGMGKALGGGSGWVILAWSPRDRRLVNTWAADHTMTLAGGSPIAVLDMYEHAYALDYGAKAGAYVDAVMGALDWGAADRRFALATS